MSKWIEKPLGEVTSYLAKGIPPKYVDELSDNAIYVLNQKCNRNFTISFEPARIHDLSKKNVAEVKMLQPGDVLINSTGVGTAGRIAQIWDIPYPTTTDGHMITLRPTLEVDPLLYGYAIKSYQTQIENLAEGSTGQTELNKTRLQNEIILRFPENKEEQYRIALFLENIDKKIAVNEKINRNLMEQAEAIYKSMFISNLDTDWELGKLSDLINVKYGKDHKKLEDGMIPVYGSGGVMRYVERSLYENESVLIPRKGSLHNVLYVNEPFWSVDTMFYSEMKIPNIAKFIYHFLCNQDLVGMNAGSAVPSMTTAILNAIEIRIPSEEVLEEFESVVSPMYIEIQENNRQSEKLRSLRDTLLPKLMSGDLDVSYLDI